MKIAMVEYQGRCDEKGTAVGHSPKVLCEYYKIIKEFADVTIYAPRTILRSIDRKISHNAKVLPHQIVMRGHNSLMAKIFNKLHMFKNIRLALKNSTEDVIWFFNVEFYLMLYLAMHGNSGKRIVCTMFIGGFRGGFVGRIKQLIFEKAQKKIDCIIGTGADFSYKNCNSTFIPDYYYDNNLLGKYADCDKKPYAVCLGTMGADKELEEMLAAFSDTNYGLKVVGRFYDKARYETLVRETSDNDNIDIRDEYLSTDEYYSLLAEASYCVLPYNPNKYGIQTSGVLQEAAFVHTIPISYNEVLKASGLPGIGFDTWSEFDGEALLKDNKKIVEEADRLVGEYYLRDKVIQKYREIFK